MTLQGFRVFESLNVPMMQVAPHWQAASFPRLSKSHRVATIFSRSLQIAAAAPPVSDGSKAAKPKPKPTLSDDDLRLFKELHPSVQREQPKVGAFQQLPMVSPAEELLAAALRKAKKVEPPKFVSNILKRERGRGAMLLDALMKELSVPLTQYFDKFPRSYDLHAYERSVLEFTLGISKYDEVLQNVNKLRKKLTSTGKMMAAFCNKSESKREAIDRKDEGIHELTVIFNENADAIEELKETAKTLRRLPVVNPRIPILCLVGAPNVGKSSLVRILSTGKPEVCDYPFTTRAISMGHIVDNFTSYQVTDTPGLLNRKDGDRNDMEKLTLACLAYLPTAVLYVHDLTGECGTSLEDQFFIYKEIRDRFPNRLWIDVVSKADLLSIPEPLDSDAVDELSRYKRLGPPGALRVSIETKQNVPELCSGVLQVLRTIEAQIKRQEAAELSEEAA